MNRIKIFQVHSFADRLFSGNPAAVCILDDWINDGIMQSIAAENNLAETAYIVQRDRYFEIRWFTPAVEVDLCGHATLAAAYVLFNCLGHKKPEVKFHSPRSGELKATRQNDIVLLDFPADTLTATGEMARIRVCIGFQPNEVYKGRTDYVAVVDNEDEVRNLKPDLHAISKLQARGLIVTAKGDQVDFVSRFFAPQIGIDEDPVTGSAHTSLIPLWSGKLGKREMNARQLSKRGGSLLCVNNGKRCLIGGVAKLYLTGEIHISL